MRFAVLRDDINNALKDAMKAGDSRRVSTLRLVIDRQTWFYRVFGTFFMAFGCCALLLASEAAVRAKARSLSVGTGGVAGCLPSEPVTSAACILA